MLYDQVSFRYRLGHIECVGRHLDPKWPQEAGLQVKSGSRLRIDHPSQTAVRRLLCVTRIWLGVKFGCDTVA